MPYPVLPPPPPPLVETIPAESISAEDELGIEINGGNLGSGIISRSASESALSGEETSTDEAQSSSARFPQEQNSQASNNSITDSRSVSSSTSGVALSNTLSLATLEPASPENFSPEFSRSEGEVVQADITPVHLHSDQSGNAEGEGQEHHEGAIAPTSFGTTSPRDSAAVETGRRQSSYRQSSRSSLDVDRLLEEGAIAAQQRQHSSEASLNSSESLIRTVAEESSPSDIRSSDDTASALVNSEVVFADASSTATAVGIPPLNVDQLLAEGLEGFRARSVRVEAVRRTESLTSSVDAMPATDTRASALGGRVSVWPQAAPTTADRFSSQPLQVFSQSSPPSNISRDHGSQVSSTESELSSGDEPLSSVASSQQSSDAAGIEALGNPADADAEALETAAIQHYEFIKQDLDLASAQLIEPLGDTFSALYDLAQELVDENENQDSLNENEPDAFPTIPEPEEVPVLEGEPILIIPVEESEETLQETDGAIEGEIEEQIEDEPGDLPIPEVEVDAQGSEEEPEVNPDLDSPDLDPPDLDPPDLDPTDGSLLEPPSPVPGPSGAPIDVAPGDALELMSDRQTYDTIRRVFIAEGNVELLVRGVVLTADRVQVNLPNKIAVAQGNVVLTRGQQVLRGDRIEYNLVREEGVVSAARGEIFIPQISSDTEVTRTDTDSRVESPPLSGQLAADQPPVETATTTGSLTIGLGSGSSGISGGGASGDIRQLRFEADTIDFTSQGWEATNVRITNDPFSPPELEIRTDRATFRRLSPTRSELVASNPRLVFDQGFSLPLFRRRFVFDENQRDQGIVQFGFDREDRGGLYIERTFEPLVTPFATLSIRPQYFIQRALGGDTDDETASPDQDDNDGGLFDPDSFGLVASLDVDIDTRTSFEGRLEMTSLDLADFDDEGRGSVRLQRGVLPILHRGTRQPEYHTLTAEYSYRDRLFNGTLGFQTVQRTFGLVFTSPTIQLTGEPDSQGLEFTYQAAIQRINANVTLDRREDLLPPPPIDNVRTSLTRYQVAAQLRRLYFLWIGTALPATPDEGLKYTPSPVTPYIAVVPRVQGVASFYSSGDVQPILTGELALLGQFGHFSRPFLDYFGFNLTYRQSTEGSESPFDFDRLRDRQVLSGGATFQIYGPFRAGFRTSISLDEDQEFDNSFFLEYSRRTYGIVLSFNPDRETGALTFRLSDFTWTGTPEPFGGSGVRTVEESVVPVEPPAGSE